MKIVSKSITKKQLQEMADLMFGNLVKGVVDIEKEIMAIDGELHADEEALLIQNGSMQKNLWGINLYPEITGDDFIEFDSMINIRPSVGNKTRGVDDLDIQKCIREIVQKLIQE
jgi:hypothetical protein